jgi:PIN domain nuclease of toxin-antitoxin system
MSYLLDTHVLIWALTKPERLPPAVTQIVDDNESYPFSLAAISTWEIAMLASKGRIELRCPVANWLEAALNPAFVRLLPLTPAIAIESTTLPEEFHADPADRLIVATARVHDLTLVTADKKILAYPHVRTFWGD